MATPSRDAASVIDSLDRDGVEKMAAAVLREVAKQSIRRNRNVVTATREAAQLHHLALRLERFADGTL